VNCGAPVVMTLRRTLRVPHFISHIGICGRCMRQSFIVAILSVWLFSFIYLHFGRSASLELYIAAVLAFSSVLLWLTHVVTFAIRLDGEDNNTDDLLCRRKLVTRIMLIAIATAAATAIPRVSYAWNECPGRLNCGPSSCTDSEVYCCPKGYPILNLCNCRCYSNVHDVIRDGCSSTGSCFDQNF
jgi:hypothetical protein